MMNLEGKIALVTGASVVLAARSRNFLSSEVLRLSVLLLLKVVRLLSASILVITVKA